MMNSSNEGEGVKLVTLSRKKVLGGQERDDYISMISRVLSGKVKRAYLFGSIARGTFGGASDVDLILVADTDRHFLERFHDYPEVFETANDIDLLVYTPEEFARLTEPPCSPFWKDVVNEAIRVV